MLLLSCILIYNNLYSIGHDEIECDEYGERDMPTIVHFEIPSDTSKDQKSSIINCLGGILRNGQVRQKEWNIG